ncbi:hypothetical protein M8C21_026675 [Ambrosia artemisiifolia]|uniref:Uncharacterized protein n=1 Tax=Ambrosia artemisiifolia TaxID=4212 RepID=A0AAD5D7X1_AMBAR|nr:hypothetical protein M8C21_026675 [Ambrosia artemisiifolia]
MLQSKSFVRKTKQGKVVKVVSEHYLRDDIHCGALFCKVLDTNVVLNQGFSLGNLIQALESVDDQKFIIREYGTTEYAVYMSNT